MSTLYQILGLIAAGAIGWIIYKSIQGRPEVFTKENLNKSFFTMGILAVILIAFVALLVLVLRAT